jgi:phenol 2-monooxygenase
MGAFGLNASILDAANLAWKIGLSVKNRADFTKLLPTYDRERRLHAAHIIEVSGKYLRFVCSSPLPTATLYHVGADLGIEGIPEFERIVKSSTGANGKANGETTMNHTNGTNGTNPAGDEDDIFVAKRVAFKSPEEAKAFVGAFFAQHGPFLLGVDAPYGRSCLNPPEPGSREHGYSPIQVYNGVRAPNPRLCLDDSRTGYLYDCLPGPNRMHLVLFGWDLCGAVREQLRAFSNAIQPESGQGGFYWKYGGPNQFNLVLVAKGTPQEIRDRLAEDELLQALGEAATVLSDDRAPDEDAHSTYGVHHRTGAVVVIRPDLWVGYSAAPRAVRDLEDYFGGFLLPVNTAPEA